ncbi:SDR family NAD(P)-dependent oxidoreductase [Paraburkholderia dipogonis]|uniref:SDR family NAD(P)-dependent oxidoreductase n=1 Tax=Paraburkholderia dipogonis TaxID=1211383 RepID=UPI0038B90463
MTGQQDNSHDRAIVPGMIGIITGAASGIGEGIAIKFLQMGCSVLAVDMNAEALERFQERHINAGSRLSCATADVTDETNPAKLFALCRERLGEPNFLVNNAGLGSAKAALETSDETWHRYIDINLGSVFRMSRQAVLEMKNGGAVVNLASVWGMVGFRGTAPYSAAKAGVIGLTRQMAADYSRQGVRFNAVSPGFIATPATFERIKSNRWLVGAMVDQAPLGRTGTPADIAEAVYFLASGAASFITGVILPVDGGWTATHYAPDLEEQAV